MHLNARVYRKVKIGKDCPLINNIEMHATSHHIIKQNGLIENASKDIIIGNHVWIGLQTLVL